MNKILSKTYFSEKVVKLEVEAPLIAKARKPGNFVIVRVGEKGERMPLTIADANLERGSITLVVQVMGVSSRKLCALEVGDYITDLVGPLGKPTHIEKVGTVLACGGGVGVAPLLPIVRAFKEALGSEKTMFYRNKLEFTFSNKRWLTEEEVKQDVKYDQMNAVGFHIPGAFDKVLAIEKCWLQDDISNQIRNAIRDFAYEHNYEFFDLRSQEGMLRNMMVRTSSTGELMVLLQCKITSDAELDKMKVLLQFVADKFPQITSLLYVINNKCNDTIGDLDVEVFKGNDHIFEEMEGLRFKVGPKSFYQTNSEQAYNLYKVARNFAGLTGNELVYDLYTGTGTIANFVSRQAKKVIGIEYVPEAIEDAKVNSALNKIENTLFYAGDMKDILTQDFINQHGRPDVIITDPPRAGMHDDVINTILFAEPERIVYVSCNPATQARDLSLLSVKYAVKKVQPVDMFPHTHHVENVVLLEKLKSKN